MHTPVVVQPLPFDKFVEVVLQDAALVEQLDGVVEKSAQEELLKYYYLRAGGTFRDLAEILENVARAGLQDADAVRVGSISGTT